MSSVTKAIFVDTGAHIPTLPEMTHEASRLQGLLENKLARFPAHKYAPAMSRLVTVLEEVQAEPKRYDLDKPEGIQNLQSMMNGVAQFLSDKK